MALTASAIVQRNGAILLVKELGPQDVAPTWMLPGGRVESGEDPVAAVKRELAEETGLTMAGTPVLAFAVEITASMDDLVGTWRALTYACTGHGPVRPADPDGLVLSAEWVELAHALERLEAVEWYDSAPLRAFLDGAAQAGAEYRYELAGRRGAVTRTIVEVLAG